MMKPHQTSFTNCPSTSAPLTSPLTLRFVVSSCALFFSLFFASSVFGQISAPNFTPPPEKKSADATAQPSLEARAAKHQAPMSLVRKDISPAQVKEIRLDELTATERTADTKKKRFRIGVLRQMPNIAQKRADFSQFASGDGTLYLMRIISPQASALRLHFADLVLPDGAALFAYARTKPDVFAGPYNRQTTKEITNVWTPTLPGEEVIVELFIPAGITLDAIPFRIDAISHSYRNPRTLINSGQSKLLKVEAAGECEQEVPAEWQSKSNAVGLITFVKTDGEYACSGTLLTDVKKTRIPFFLTANHCIGNDQEATSAEVYWFFDSGTEPIYAPTRGAKLLVTDAGDDYTLLEVSKPPDGVTYSGWTTVPPEIGATVTTIHHPQADHKRYSSGQIVDAACPAEVPSEFCNFYTKARWSSGITEPGSSGAGLFVGPANDSRLVGILSGGESACDNLSGVDFFARFNRMFGAIGYYLTNGELCRYTLLQDKFSFGQSGGQSEFTVVPKIGGENCPWQARSNVSWVTLTATPQGNGLGKVEFQVAANPSDKPRLGAISVAGRNVLIFQAPAIPSDSPCAADKIEMGQSVAGDLRTATCRSLIEGELQARRYAFEAEAGQSVSISFRQSAHNSRYRLIYPDGRIVPFRDSYPTLLPLTGTYLIELSLLRSQVPYPVPYDFTIWKGCKYKFSSTYFEVDGFGAALSTPSSFARMNTEITGENCFNLFATADEPVIDENKLHASYSAAEKAVILAVNGAEDPKQRHIVIRFLDQPVIIRQTPRCSSATSFAYTPSELNLPGTGGQFQMDIKRTAGPTCSWQINPYQVYETSESTTREVRFQPEDSNNQVRGTGDGQIQYKVSLNSSLRTNRYVLKNNGQVAQTIRQTSLRASCTPTPLQVGQSITGELTTSDCGWDTPGHYLDAYQLNVLPGEQIAFEFAPTEASAGGFGLAVDLGVPEVGFVMSPQGPSGFRWPNTGFHTVNATGSYLLFAYGKPISYRLKILGLGPAGCVYKIDKEGEIILPADTTSFSLQMDCNRSDCDWTAQSSANWISFPNGASGKGSQTIALTLTPNTGAKRWATITVAGRTFSLVQDFPCSYRQFSTPAPDKFFASYVGGEYRYSVTTGATCPPPAITSNANWVSATATTNLITLKIDANTAGFRQAIVKVDGQDYQVMQGGNDLVVTTAADYQRVVAPGSLVTLFNQGMSIRTEAAQRLPLPISLADVRIHVQSSDGFSYIVPLLYVSPTQVNFYLHEHLPPGRAKIRLSSGPAWYGTGNSLLDYAIGEFEITAIAPNVFSADSTGKGPAAADIQRVRPGQPVVYEPVATVTLDEQGKPMAAARPIQIGEGDEKTYLVLYATGLRKRNANAAVTAQIGDVTLPVEYAGPQGQYVGLDQINILLPPSLRGKGLVTVTVTIDGKTTNPVQINLAP